MKRYLLVFASICVGVANADPCTTAPLTSYLNNVPDVCTLDGGTVTVTFNHDLLLPAYTGLGVLGSAPSTGEVTVTPGSSSLTFTSDEFHVSGISTQATLVHFLLDSSTTPFTSTTFSLIDADVSGGLGAAAVIGQELVCVGGTFTSLPVGLVTSVTNGVLGTGTYGCNGTALIGTAAVQAGLLSTISSVLGLALPNLVGVTDSAYIQLTPTNAKQIDVIKIQVLLAAGLFASASTEGFGNTYTRAASNVEPVPEPQSVVLFGAGSLVLGLFRTRLQKLLRKN
jgi:hypothetical protein